MMGIKECTVEIGSVLYHVKYEHVNEASSAHVDPCGICGENDPDTSVTVQEVVIYEVTKGGKKLSADDAVFSVIKDILNDDHRTVTCEQCAQH